MIAQLSDFIMNVPWWDRVNSKTKEQLKKLSFDQEEMELRRQKVLSGDYSKEGNYCRTTPLLPKTEDLIYFPARDSAAYNNYYELGIEALKSGHVGVAILNGGMATRLGGIVKGALLIRPTRSFLELKVEDVRLWQERLSAPIPLFLLNSFATDSLTKEHLLKEDAVTINYLLQGVSLRLTPGGEIFWTEQDKPSLYAPGHGDMLRAWQNSAAARAWSQDPQNIILIGNVDNLNYTINPVIIGMFLSQNEPILVETVAKLPGDVGGAPAWYNGKLQTIERFRFPPEFDQEKIEVFATNSFVVKAEELLIKHEFSWYYVLKEAHGLKLLQLEKLINELTAFMGATYIVAPRTGPDGRFLPIKTAADMEKARKSFFA